MCIILYQPWVYLIVLHSIEVIGNYCHTFVCECIEILTADVNSFSIVHLSCLSSDHIVVLHVLVFCSLHIYVGEYKNTKNILHDISALHEHDDSKAFMAMQVSQCADYHDYYS